MGKNNYLIEKRASWHYQVVGNSPKAWESGFWAGPTSRNHVITCDVTTSSGGVIVEMAEMPDIPERTNGTHYVSCPRVGICFPKTIKWANNVQKIKKIEETQLFQGPDD